MTIASVSERSLHAAAFTFLFALAFTKNTSTTHGHGLICPEIEKQSLLSFKQSVEDPDSMLSSWDVEVDCCRWKGVVCDDFTGHVTHLFLQYNYSGIIGDAAGLSGKINSSLLNLKHLTHLDLSRNRFYGEAIPSFMGSFAGLEYLNLYRAGFQGRIPHTIGNLSNLRLLSLANSEAAVDSLEWLSGLSKLEYLNMDDVDLSKAIKWQQQVITSLPCLLQLHFRNCGLDFSAPLSDVNVTTSLITLLDLSNHYFDRSMLSIPKWIFQLNNLVYLDLKDCYFGGPIPISNNATKLRYLDLSNNDCNSSIPDWLYSSTHLEFLDLSSNSLSGTISTAIANLTSLKKLSLFSNQLWGEIPRGISHLCKLEILDLSNNYFNGSIPDSFGNAPDCLESLRVISFANNQLSGAIPAGIGKLLGLRELYLYLNKLTGNLPESLGQLANLHILSIEDNMFGGDVTEIHFANLTRLEEFSASANHLTWKTSPNWIPPFQLRKLGLGSWNLGLGSGSQSQSQIPSWVQKQINITWLNLSNTGVSGSVPSWFWEMGFLMLSHNNLTGEIPHLNDPSTEDHNPPQRYIYLDSNQFSGSLPRVGGAVAELDLSNNSFSGGMSHFLCDTTPQMYVLELGVLHVGGNQLSGELPDCWMNWTSLAYLNLGNNNMYGSIPNSITHLAQLVSLNLQNNRFSGHIPLSMQNCRQLRKLDLSGNDLNGSLPTWMGTSLLYLRVLILSSNKLSGNISQDICHLNFLQILDLSDNRISGVLPGCLSNYTAMATKRDLDYRMAFGSHDESVTIETKGRELLYKSILPLVTHMDLSKNNLSGEIPEGLMSLVELRSLNLSGNGFTGSIPGRIGEMKVLESLDLSRNSLAGQIPDGFTLLYSLNYLNLSYNKLTGRIPTSTQLQSLDARSFIGNDLCGPPSTRNCSSDSDGEDVHPQEEEKQGDDTSKIDWLYVLLSLGFAVGFSGVCTTLVLNKSWRVAYFGFMECTWDKLYVYFYVKWRRLTKPAPPSS